MVSVEHFQFFTQELFEFRIPDDYGGVLMRAKFYKDSSYTQYMPRKFHLIIESSVDRGYIGIVPELEGCHSQGETIEELKENIKEAIQLCLEDNDEDIVKVIGVEEILV